VLDSVAIGDFDFTGSIRGRRGHICSNADGVKVASWLGLEEMIETAEAIRPAVCANQSCLVAEVYRSTTGEVVEVSNLATEVADCLLGIGDGAAEVVVVSNGNVEMSATADLRKHGEVLGEVARGGDVSSCQGKIVVLTFDFVQELRSGFAVRLIQVKASHPADVLG